MTSVVVPAHNNERQVGALLHSLAAQDHVGAWEVILADNRSTDRTVLEAREWHDRLPLRIVPAPLRANPAYARNRGASAALGENLLFVDADDTVGPEYVRVMSEALLHEQFVTSRVDSQQLNAAWLQRAHGPHWQVDGVGVLYEFLPSGGANIGIRRRLFETLGGFPETLSGSEDVAFCWNAQLSGVPLVFVSGATYHYRYRSSLRALIRQSANWGRDSVRLFAEFRPAGMPGRSASQIARDWAAALSAVLSARTRADLAAASVKAGLCVGRFYGSLRDRCMYL